MVRTGKQKVSKGIKMPDFGSRRHSFAPGKLYLTAPGRHLCLRNRPNSLGGAGHSECAGSHREGSFVSGRVVTLRTYLVTL